MCNVGYHRLKGQEGGRGGCVRRSWNGGNSMLKVAAEPEHKVTASLQQMLLTSCLTSQQHASISQGQICSDHCTHNHTEMEVANPTF